MSWHDRFAEEQRGEKRENGRRIRKGEKKRTRKEREKGEKSEAVQTEPDAGVWRLV